MLASWVSEEVKDVDLGDKRLNERMGQILDQLQSSYREYPCGLLRVCRDGGGLSFLRQRESIV